MKRSIMLKQDKVWQSALMMVTKDEHSYVYSSLYSSARDFYIQSFLFFPLFSNKKKTEKREIPTKSVCIRVCGIVKIDCFIDITVNTSKHFDFNQFKLDSQMLTNKHQTLQTDLITACIYLLYKVITISRCCTK